MVNKFLEIGYTLETIDDALNKYRITNQKLMTTVKLPIRRMILYHLSPNLTPHTITSRNHQENHSKLLK